MPIKLFARTFAARRSQAETVFRHYGGVGGDAKVADAWEIFVSAAAFSRAPVRERVKFVFGLFDMERNEVLSKEMLAVMLRCAANGVRKMLRPLGGAGAGAGGGVFGGDGDGQGEGGEEEDVDAAVDRLVNEALAHAGG